MLTECLKIEFASVADAAEISRLSRRHIEYNLRRVYTPGRVRDAIRHRSKNVVVARSEQNLIGFGIMTYGENTANLDLLAVKPDFRRRGVATRLLRWLEKVAQNAGIQQIFVQVRKPNLQAIRLYQKLGYMLIDEIAGYYQGREAAVIMGKSARRLFRSGVENTSLQRTHRAWKTRINTSRR